MPQEIAITPKGRVIWASVFKTAIYEGEDSGKYEVTLIFDPETDLSGLKKLARNAAAKTWGDKLPSNLKTPFRPCEEKADFAGMVEGGTFVRFSTQHKPDVVGGSVDDYITAESGRFYDGCYARASVAASTYDHKGAKGIKFYLQNIQKLGDGEPIGYAKTAAADDFDNVETAEGLVGPAAAGTDSFLD